MNHHMKVAKLADAVKAHPDALTREDLPEQNYFGDGVLVRVLPVPKGVAVVGKLHKTRNVFGLLRGIMLVSDGGKMYRYDATDAPVFVTSEIGAQRVLYAVSDCVLMNAHACDTDQPLEDIEDELTANDIRALDAYERELLQ